MQKQNLPCLVISMQLVKINKGSESLRLRVNPLRDRNLIFLILFKNPFIKRKLYNFSYFYPFEVRMIRINQNVVVSLGDC